MLDLKPGNFVSEIRVLLLDQLNMRGSRSFLMTVGATVASISLGQHSSGWLLE